MRLRRHPRQTRTAATHRVHGRPIAPPWPEGLEVVLLGMGCFWAAERRFWDLPGVWTTAAGFTPGHTEVVLVVLDPAVTDLPTLLETFWDGHDPTVPQGRLYRSVIGSDDAGLRQVAAEDISRHARRLGRPVHTQVVGGAFIHASAEQQQYLA